MDGEGAVAAAAAPGAVNGVGRMAVEAEQVGMQAEQSAGAAEARLEVHMAEGIPLSVDTDCNLAALEGVVQQEVHHDTVEVAGKGVVAAAAFASDCSAVRSHSSHTKRSVQEEDVAPAVRTTGGYTGEQQAAENEAVARLLQRLHTTQSNPVGLAGSEEAPEAKEVGVVCMSVRG